MHCAPTGSGPVGSINRRVHVTTGTKMAVVVGTNRAAADVWSRTASRARRRWIQTRLDAVWARFIETKDVADEMRGRSAVGGPLTVVVCMPGSRQSVRPNGKERGQAGDRLTASVNDDVESLHREWWLQLTVERLNASVIGRLAAKCRCCCCCYSQQWSSHHRGAIITSQLAALHCCSVIFAVSITADTAATEHARLDYTLCTCAIF